MTLLPMVFWPPYPCNIDPPTHGILTPLSMVYQPLYPWYFDPPTHRISTPLHDILTSLHIFWLEMGGFKIPWGFNLPYRRGSVFNKGVQYTMDVNRPRVQNTIWHRVLILPVEGETTCIKNYYFRIKSGICKRSIVS